MATNRFSKVPPKTPEEFVEAAPMATVEPDLPLPPPIDPPHFLLARKAPEGGGEGVYRAVTLRLDKERYKKIKMKATVEETSIQQILIDALDRHLA